MHFNEELRHLADRLKRFEKRGIFIRSARGIQITLILTVSLFLLFISAEAVFHFSSQVRTGLFLGWMIAFLFSLSYHFFFPVSRLFFPFDEGRYISAAEESGNYFPEVKDTLSNSLQIILFADERWSASLAGAEFRRVYTKTKDILFHQALSSEPAKKLLLYSLPLLIFVLTLVTSVPAFGDAAHRFFNYKQEFIPPAPFSFAVSPGNAKVTKGESISVTIQVIGQKKTSIDFFFKDASETELNKVTLDADSAGLFTYRFSAVRNTTVYLASSGDVQSEQFTLEVVDYPVIRSLEATVSQPAYSGLPLLVQRDNGSFSALAGSTLNLKIEATRNLLSAWLLVNDSTVHPLRTDGQSAAGSLRFKESFSYKIYMTDTDSNRNISPVEYSITALQDGFPLISMIEPAKDINLSSDQRVALLLGVSDDYGFSRLILHYKLVSSRYELPWQEFRQIEIPITKGMREGDVSYIWNVSALNLATEDIISFYAEVFDNDAVSGPKSAKTDIRNLRLPSLDELFAQSDKSLDNVEKEMKELMKDAEELKKELDKIDRNLKQDKKELSFEEKERIEKAVEKFEELQKKSEELNQKLSESKEDLQKNNLLTQETLEKYMELQNLMERLSSEEMKRAMEKLNQSLQTMDRKQVQQAMQNMQFDEETFRKSLERTIELFKRVQAEQKTDELLKRAEELEKKQQELSEELKNNKNPQKNDQLAKKQDEISKQSDQLEKEMEDLQKLLEELSDLPKEELDKLKEEFEKQENSKLSDQAKQDIQKNQSSQARQKMQQLSKNFQQTKESLMNFQNSMQQETQMQTFMDMMKMLNDMIDLSKKEEELKNDLQQGRQQHADAAREQEKIRKSLEQLLSEMAELSKKTFAITPEMGKSLGDAMRNMMQAMEALQNRNGTQAANNAENAMKSLNDAASLMKGSMEAMMSQSGGQGGGMMSMMQQLGQMSGQQMSLNQMTQQLQQGSDGQLNPQQQAELQRLAQQQELIQKSLEQLNQEAKEAGKSKGLTSNLDDLVRKMEEVITEMRTGYADDELIQKQERILSKLLDAQRSTNERDYEKERESFTGTNVRRESPADLMKNPSDRNSFFQEELNRLSKEGYSRDYEELIRKYFELLRKSN